MVEADRLPRDMLSIGIQQQPSYTVTIPILVGSDFGVLGHLWSQNDVNTSWSGIFAPPANALGLSIEEKDFLFCTHIGRWPLPLPSYLCNPVNVLGLSIEEKDLLFCTCIGRWPLPLPSYLYAILPMCLASQLKRRTSSSANA